MCNNYLKSFRTWLSKGNRASWCLFVLFCIVLFVKTMIFHFSVDYGILVSSLWKNPTEFFRFWGGKIVPILFLGSFIFLSKRFWWTYIANLIVDLWCIANLFYYKANTLFLSYETIKMADNMSGFWDSLLSYMGWDIVSFVITTIIYIPLITCCTYRITTKRQPLIWGIILTCSMVLVYVNNFCYKSFVQSWNIRNSDMENIDADAVKYVDFNHYYPFGQVQFFFEIAGAVMEYDFWSKSYVKDNSIISYLPACIVYHLIRPEGHVVSLSEQQIKELSTWISQDSDSINMIPYYNVVFLLVESLESWPVDSVCGLKFMPNLNKLKQDSHVLYCSRLKSQVKHGNSADGQMIAVTGILPILDGATCILFGKNQYPSYASLYTHSAIFNPASGMWQQSKVTFQYKFQELIEPERNNRWEDLDLCKQMLSYISEQQEPFCILGITISSHGPFSYGEQHPQYTIPKMPKVMNNYLNCLHYTDSCVSLIIDAIMQSELSQNTTIVITGDHTIFRSYSMDIDLFANKNNIAMQTSHTYCPLIIYSPHIEGNIQVTDTCYQMDIYPTIMHLIGCEDYYWKGFGVNLLDSAARHNRLITEQEAYRLSDLMIRSNYFETYLKQ